MARSNWYPANAGMKDYATYSKRFSVPRRLRLVATGDLVDEATREGQTVLAVKVSQANVPDHFVMLVPIYAELQDGRVVRLGSTRLRGNTSFEQEIPLRRVWRTAAGLI